ncbi:hypothetical protein [Mucilaginibacter paludis]|uniref:Uncharacterized protein n=1 Tax=Mucilaginibacter paludis DSM 18603 TaxID=714943 RepID=H1Y6P2_9SPHI|nr:hypothetical protein [Mucilaginibacter paludis]EHQ26834.1 hypothetical protein Mucpa_2722 [Mucilaginibacter paludis DSM 18603]
MNEIEEKLWNYIDGSCSVEEQQAIGILIESNEAYKLKFDELLKLNAEFAAIELDEPSMAFTYNVMEAIRTETAQQPLKAAIDKRIIRIISAFFVIAIAFILIAAFSSVNWSAVQGGNYQFSGVKIPQLQNYLSATVVKGFICFDVVLGLVLLDSYLRKKISNKQSA